MTSENDGLIFALTLNGDGAATAIDWDQLQERWDDASTLWVHLDYSHERVQNWLLEHSGIDPHICSALTSEETRPRSLVEDDDLLLIMRGINHNPGADLEDMVSLRMWVNKNSIITLRQRKLLAIEDVKAKFDAGRGPKNAGGVLTMLTQALVARTSPVIFNLDEQMDELEEATLTQKAYAIRSGLTQLRRQTISIRRYLSPQRDATSQILLQDISWLSGNDRGAIREISDRLTRYVEELDSIRERASVTQEELNTRLNERTNRIVYILSLITAIFLPLGFITGLLGINVGGMPGIENDQAFWNVCFAIALATLIEVYIIIRFKLLK